MQQSNSKNHAEQHGYPTPPHSPDLPTSPPSTASSSLSPLSSPPSSRDHTPPPTHQHATVDASFDPLEGYIGAHAPPVSGTGAGGTAMSGKQGRGGAAGGSAGATTAAAGGGTRSSVASAPSSSTAPAGQQPRRKSSRSASDFSQNRDRASSSGSGGGGVGGGGGGGKERVWTKEERRKAKMFPPSAKDVLFETEEEWQEHHDKEATSGWHHLPLVLVALPPLGAIVHGRAENWSDPIILLLICFYLYQLIKVPWDLYYASHARILLSYPTPSSLSSPSSPSDPLAEHRAASAASLRRSELLSLSLTFLVPVLGASLLHYARGLLSDPERYINRSVVGLFMIAASVRPLGRAGEIWKRSTLYHQSLVHYPSSEVYQLRKRVEGLENELKELSPTFATRSSLHKLSHTLSSPLTKLDKELRRTTRRADYFRLTTEEKFAALVGEMDEVREREEEREREVDELKRRVEVGEASVSRVALHVARHLLLHLARSAIAASGGRETRELGWYEKGVAWYVFWPVNVPRKAIGWGVERAIEVVGLPEGSAGASSSKGGNGARRLAAPGGGGRKRVEGPPL
ncbi:hypothetical protein JCM11251_004935 [Rhodosporidiobolus azoricus]